MPPAGRPRPRRRSGRASGRAVVTPRGCTHRRARGSPSSPPSTRPTSPSRWPAPPTRGPDRRRGLVPRRVDRRGAPRSGPASATIVRSSASSAVLSASIGPVWQAGVTLRPFARAVSHIATTGIGRRAEHSRWRRDASRCSASDGGRYDAGPAAHGGRRRSSSRWRWPATPSVARVSRRGRRLSSHAAARCRAALRNDPRARSRFGTRSPPRSPPGPAVGADHRRRPNAARVRPRRRRRGRRRRSPRGRPVDRRGGLGRRPRGGAAQHAPTAWWWWSPTTTSRFRCARVR